MSDYWKDRQAAAQSNLTAKNIDAINKQIQRYYSKAAKSIISDFESTLTKVYEAVGEGRAPTPADLYKLDKYWHMQGQLKQKLNSLGNKQLDLLFKNFVNHYSEIYEAIALKDDLFFGKISSETVEQMINQIWCADGKSWSSRVWANTDKLQQALNDNLIDCVLTGKKTSLLKKILQDEFAVSYSRAETIVRTEMAHIQTQAAKQRYQDAGIQQVQVWADKDERRCEHCGQLHEKLYPIHSNIPIPAHPRCRCCIIPVID